VVDVAAVLVLNAGSSSLKFKVISDGGGVLVKGAVERMDESGPAAALHQMAGQIESAGVSVTTVGHRVVHGGPEFSDPVLVDDAVLARIEAMGRYAPLHNPPAAAGIRAAREEFPGVPQVAVFDTAFFSSLPAFAATYAIDASVAKEHGIKRYGAHGTSHRYVSGAAAAFSGRELDGLRQITLHLGNGASAAAISGGRPVDTSMGLTPLEGLVMGTRAGDLDPGVLLHLLRTGLSVDELDDLLEHRSGLQGLAGRHDFRDLRTAIAAGDEQARLAIDVYCHRLRKYVGGYLAALGGADQIVFTGGVGEHDAPTRGQVLAGLAPLGIELDESRNQQPTYGPRRISADHSPVEVLVVPTDEEAEIAREALLLVGRGP